MEISLFWFGGFLSGLQALLDITRCSYEISKPCMKKWRSIFYFRRYRFLCSFLSTAPLPPAHFNRSSPGYACICSTSSRNSIDITPCLLIYAPMFPVEESHSCLRLLYADFLFLVRLWKSLCILGFLSGTTWTGSPSGYY